MKEAIIGKVDGGYIVQLKDGGQTTIAVATNFGQVNKALRAFFDEQVERNGSSNVERAAAA